MKIALSVQPLKLTSKSPRIYKYELETQEIRGDEAGKLAELLHEQCDMVLSTEGVKEEATFNERLTTALRSQYEEEDPEESFDEWYAQQMYNIIESIWSKLRS